MAFVPPLVNPSVPPNVIAPVVAVLGVNPVVPALNDKTPVFAIVTALEPLKLVPDNPVPIVKVFVVFAVIVPLLPSDIDVLLTVILELAKLAFVMPAVPLKLLLVKPVIVFELAAIVLFVNVSEVARPTKVSVDVGKVNVPVFVIVEITGAVSVLFVNVCVPDNVTTDESMAIVVATEPLYDVPVKPVPIVNAKGLIAVIVALPPNAIALPFTVIELLVSPEFGIVALI